MGWSVLSCINENIPNGIASRSQVVEICLVDLPKSEIRPLVFPEFHEKQADQIESHPALAAQPARSQLERQQRGKLETMSASHSQMGSCADRCDSNRPLSNYYNLQKGSAKV